VKYVETYFISYGPTQRTAHTLKDARAIAKTVSRATLYEIKIVQRGDLVETLVPRIARTGRVTFRTRKN
jgi:hypothetical protein